MGRERERGKYSGCNANTAGHHTLNIFVGILLRLQTLTFLVCEGRESERASGEGEKKRDRENKYARAQESIRACACQY